MTERIIVTPEAFDALYRSQHPVVKLRTFSGGLVQTEVATELRQQLVWDIRPAETMSDVILRHFR